MKSGLHVTHDSTLKLLDNVKTLTGTNVLIGIPADKAGRDDGQTNNAQIGYIQEFGSPAHNIPPRPFLVPGVMSIQDAAQKLLRRAAEESIGRDPDEAKKYLNAVGIMGQNAVRAKITTGPFAPLAPSTIAARKRKGRTGTRPLIDTGSLRAAITYVIRKK